MLEAINFSIAALREPLSADDREYGWDESLRERMIASYEGILNELEQGPVTPHLYKGWGKGFIDGGTTDPRKHNQLVADGLRGEHAIVGVQNADKVLAEAGRLNSFLAQQVPRGELANGWTEGLRQNLQAALTRISNRLLSGDYLLSDDFTHWDRPLQSADILRHDWGITDISRRLKRFGINLELIESSPPGQWWETVNAFDYSLVSPAESDLKRGHPHWRAGSSARPPTCAPNHYDARRGRKVAVLGWGFQCPSIIQSPTGTLSRVTLPCSQRRRLSTNMPSIPPAKKPAIPDSTDHGSFVKPQTFPLPPPRNVEPLAPGPPGITARVGPETF